MKQNISYEIYSDNIDEQNQIMRDEAVDFLVVRSDGEDTRLEDVTNEEMLKHYRLIATHQQDYEEVTQIYWLLERNSNFNNVE